MGRGGQSINLLYAKADNKYDLAALESLDWNKFYYQVQRLTKEYPAEQKVFTDLAEKKILNQLKSFPRSPGSDLDALLLFEDEVFTYEIEKFTYHKLNKKEQYFCGIPVSIIKENGYPKSHKIILKTLPRRFIADIELRRALKSTQFSSAEEHLLELVAKELSRTNIAQPEQSFINLWEGMHPGYRRDQQSIHQINGSSTICGLDNRDMKMVPRTWIKNQALARLDYHHYSICSLCKKNSNYRSIDEQVELENPYVDLAHYMYFPSDRSSSRLEDYFVAECRKNYPISRQQLNKNLHRAAIAMAVPRAADRLVARHQQIFSNQGKAASYQQIAAFWEELIGPSKEVSWAYPKKCPSQDQLRKMLFTTAEVIEHFPDTDSQKVFYLANRLMYKQVSGLGSGVDSISIERIISDLKKANIR